MPKTVIAFGEVLWDLLPDGPVLGGAPFNFAFRLNSLGLNGIMISAIGNDQDGRKALEQMNTLEMDTSYIQIDHAHPTGTVEIDASVPNDLKYFIVKNVAYDFIKAADKLKDLAANADCICFGTLAQRNELSRQTLRELLKHFKGGHVFYDLNMRKDCYSELLIRESLMQSTILKLNEDEILKLKEYFNKTNLPIPEFTDFLIKETDLKYCIVTLGQNGSFVCSGQGQKVYFPSYKVNLIDTCGSGDAFSAGFIKALLEDCNLEQACQIGNALGSIVAGQRGATTQVNSSQLTEFIKKTPCHPPDPRFKMFGKKG